MCQLPFWRELLRVIVPRRRVFPPGFCYQVAPRPGAARDVVIKLMIRQASMRGTETSLGAIIRERAVNFSSGNFKKARRCPSRRCDDDGWCLHKSGTAVGVNCDKRAEKRMLSWFAPVLFLTSWDVPLSFQAAGLFLLSVNRPIAQ